MRFDSDRFRRPEDSPARDPFQNLTVRERLRRRLEGRAVPTSPQFERERLRAAHAAKLLERLGVPADAAEILARPLRADVSVALSPTLLALASGEPTPLPLSIPSPTAP